VIIKLLHINGRISTHCYGLNSIFFTISKPTSSFRYREKYFVQAITVRGYASILVQQPYIIAILFVYILGDFTSNKCPPNKDLEKGSREAQVDSLLLMLQLSPMLMLLMQLFLF